MCAIIGVMEKPFQLKPGLHKDQAVFDHNMSHIKSHIQKSHDKDSIISTEITLLLLILEEFQEINRLKEKVAWLEERLLMEISDAPPRFIPP